MVALNVLNHIELFYYKGTFSPNLLVNRHSGIDVKCYVMVLIPQ